MHKVELNLTDKENKALEELSQKMALSKEKILVQALRVYQSISLEHCELKEVNPLPKIAPWANSELPDFFVE